MGGTSKGPHNLGQYQVPVFLASVQQHGSKTVAQQPIIPFDHPVSLGVVRSGSGLGNFPSLTQLGQELALELSPLVGVQLLGQAQITEHPFI